MRRSGIVSHKTGKQRRPKTTEAKPGRSPIPARRGDSSDVDLEEKLERQARELEEAREERAATAEVLRVISSSPGDLDSVFRSILVNACRICGAHFGTIFRYDNQALVIAAWEGVPPEYLALLRSRPVPIDDGTATARAAESKRVVHIADILAERPGTKDDRLRAQLVDLGGVRTILAVPMLKQGQLVGAISMYRKEVRAFTDKQIALIQNFANQAVIAIENTRLLNELRQSLEQQTATADVLRVISSSPGQLEPVFQAMLENATRICGAKFGTMYRYNGETFHFAAEVGAPAELAEFYRRRGPFKPPPGSQIERLVRTKQPARTTDYSAEAVPGPAARLAGARAALHVPMLKDDVLLGAILIYRQEARPFTEKQIALVQNFAAQAVIAIENARLPLVIVAADHVLRPLLIGGAARLSFIWILLGIFGGTSAFGLVGLFLGPAIVAAIIALWRDLATPRSL